MSEIQVVAKCPKCGENLKLKVNTSDTISSPKTRSNLEPSGNIFMYRITSEMIKKFVSQKAKQYCPDVKIEVVPRYCEKKRRSQNEPHHAYASFRIAFSEEVVDSGEDNGWFGKIGESVDNVKFQQTIFQNLILKYRYNPKTVDEWLKSYKTMEELEDGLGMSEAYINDIRQYSNPQRIKDQNNNSWVIFAAAGENIIKDMLTDPVTNTVAGRIEIHDVYQIDKDVVEYIIYLHPQEIEYKENAHVRQILLGKEKPKK